MEQRNLISDDFNELLRGNCNFAVFFLTCGGVKTFPDPRMNSLEAAFVFAKTSDLQVK